MKIIAEPRQFYNICSIFLNEDNQVVMSKVDMKHFLKYALKHLRKLAEENSKLAECYMNEANLIQDLINKIEKG